MEKTLVFPASPPQVRPSDALPQPFWLARWKVSCAMVVPGDGEGVGETVLVGDGVFVGVVVGDLPTVGVGGGTFVCVATASLLANSSVNQMRFWLSTFRPSWGWEFCV